MLPSSSSSSDSKEQTPAQDTAIYFGAFRKIKLDKGFGFIAGDNGTDYFFHWSGLTPRTKNFRDIVLQERVSFSIVMTTKGPRAISITVL